jgi:hypothetical protein
MNALDTLALSQRAREPDFGTLLPKEKGLGWGPFILGISATPKFWIKITAAVPETTAVYWA